MVTSRIRFTAAQKAELWERWKNGQSAAAISRALERKKKTGVERIVVVHGGQQSISATGIHREHLFILTHELSINVGPELPRKHHDRDGNGLGQRPPACERDLV